MRGYSNLLTKIVAYVEVAPGIPSGTRKLFDQDSPPTGWTRDTSATLDDRLIRVVVGTRTPNGGSWTISGLSGGGHSHSYTDVISHTHSVSVGSHSHTVRIRDGNVPYGAIDEKYDDINSPISVPFGSNASSVSTGAPSGAVAEGTSSSSIASISSDGSWRPLYRDLIIAEKD